MTFQKNPLEELGPRLLVFVWIGTLVGFMTYLGLIAIMSIVSWVGLGSILPSDWLAVSDTLGMTAPDSQPSLLGRAWLLPILFVCFKCAQATGTAWRQLHIHDRTFP